MTNPQASSNTQYCQFCERSTDTGVKDSRPFMYKGEYECVRRRRLCPECDNMFTTVELPWTFVSHVQPQIDAVDDMIAHLNTLRLDLLKKKRNEEVSRSMTAPRLT